LTDLFDYFTQNFGAGLFRQPQAKRWLEAADVLDRKSNLQAHHINLVKTIGVLNAIGEFSPLAARKEVLAYSLADAVEPAGEVLRGLQFLKDESILTYRHFNHTYRIWEGSDVDLDEKIAEGAQKTRGVLSLSAMLERYLEPRPLVARKHSFETGALRFFSLVYADRLEELKIQVDSKLRGTGKIVVCVSGSAPLAEKFVETAKDLKDRSNLLLAIPQDLGELRAVTSELAALRWVWENTAELRDDRAARRELALRIADAERLLRSTLHRLLDPRPDPLGSRCVWYYGGRLESVETPADVSRLLSRVCDRLFSASPRLRNELIVRRTLSSAAAAARRNLVEAMLARGNEPALGIQGYPPERSMYESALRATGIHVQDRSVGWRFVPPPKDHETRLWPVWEYLHTLIFQPQPEPQPIDGLFRALAAPTFGVMDGLQPVLLCAFTIVYAEEVTLYREGTFIPNPGIAEFETLMRRPELFAIAGTRVQGARADTVARLAKRLSVTPATVPVVRALFTMVRSLPELAWHTSRVSRDAISLRQAFDSAKSPEKFLFVDLPQAIGMDPIPDEKLSATTVDSFFNKLNQILHDLREVAPTTLRYAQDQLLQACGLPPQPQGWQALREAAIRLEPFANHPELRAFLSRVIQSTPDNPGIASVVELVANAPFNTWTDFDIDAFPGHAKTIGILFAEAQALQASQAHRTLTEQLTPEQRRQAQKIQKQLQEYLTPTLKHNSRQSVYAALLAFAHQLQEGKD